MIAVNFSTARSRFKEFCDQVTDRAETVVVTRKAEKNVVLISAQRYNELEKAERNAAYLKKLKEEYTVIEYVGIAADETKRIKDKNYPLVEWGMTESDCLSYCYRRGFDWGGLYEIFSRVSCWCCPLQSLEELRKLYRNFPDLWRQLEEWDNSTWRTFLKNYSVRELAARFDFEDKWQAAGGNIRSRAFYSALRQELSRLGSEVTLCRK